MGKLDDVVNKYNNTYYLTIKMKLIPVKPSAYVDFIKEKTKGDPTFNVGDHVRISKFNKIFAKGYSSGKYWSNFLTTSPKDPI